MKSCRRLGALGLWLAVALLAGCGSEGGVVGSGISTATISGNVVAVQQGAALVDAAAVPRLAVRLEEFADIGTTTGDDGVFELDGDFSGPLTLRFETVTGRLLARLPLDVPAGSTVELADLEIAPGSARAREIRQRNFVGRIAQVNCALPGFVLDDDETRGFRVHLGPEAQILLRPGDRPGSCADLRPGAFARVEGLIQATDVGPVVEAATVSVGDRRPLRDGSPP